MKVTYTAHLTRAELTAVKGLLVKLMNWATTPGGPVHQLEGLRIEMSRKVKITAGNIMTALRITDTYEVEFELELDEEFTLELCKRIGLIFDIVGTLKPTMSNLIPALLDLNKFVENGSMTSASARCGNAG